MVHSSYDLVTLDLRIPSRLTVILVRNSKPFKMCNYRHSYTHKSRHNFAIWGGKVLSSDIPNPCQI